MTIPDPARAETRNPALVEGKERKRQRKGVSAGRPSSGERKEAIDLLLIYLLDDCKDTETLGSLEDMSGDDLV